MSALLRRRFAVTLSALAISTVAAACGDEVVVRDGSGGGSSAGGGDAASGGGVATGGSGGEGGGGGEDCSPSCISCCNVPECPDDVPEVHTQCDDSRVPGKTFCYYRESDGCVYHYWCNPPESTWTKTLDPIDCPGECTNPYPDAPCLDPGKTCTEESSGNCSEYTCSDEYVFVETEFHPGEPCP